MRNTEKYDFKGIQPYGPVPNGRQLRHLRKFKKKAFFHFGVNTFTDLEWGEGVEAEQVFAPTELDTRQWIRAAAQAGFTLAIITAKHHDGFCLWNSAYTEHCVKNSPCNRD
ncbi:MAG: alpha-L-fucosidase, partial [Clostridia bacterium]|nr:alpha-L-fucosidase [Clostridia bacterium]